MKEIKIGMKSEAETIVTKRKFCCYCWQWFSGSLCNSDDDCTYGKAAALPYQNAWKMTKQQLALC